MASTLLKRVPADFESGDSWVEAISRNGFDVGRPAVIALTEVSQYISVDAMVKTLREAAQLAPGTTFVCTSLVPIGRVMDPDVKELLTLGGRGPTPAACGGAGGAANERRASSPGCAEDLRTPNA